METETESDVTMEKKFRLQCVLGGLLVGLVLGWNIRIMMNEPIPVLEEERIPVLFGDDVEVPGRTIAAEELGQFRVTAYCPSTRGSGCEWVSESRGWRCCGHFADGKTASGSDASLPGIAAPKEIPFGTILVIEGYGRFKVDDRGGSITGKRLDVRFPTHQGALNWGIKNLHVLKMTGRDQ